MHSRLRLDTLRGLACLLLVSYHVIGADSASGLRLPDDHLASQTNDFLALIRMPLFSFLSGLVYAARPLRGEIGGFAKGKVRRLLVPMLIVGTGFALLQTAMSGTNNDGITEWHLLHIVPVAHYWFLESLFLIFMLTAVLERLRLMDTPEHFAAVGIAAMALHVWAPMPVYFGLNGATFLLPFFLLGVAARRFPAMTSNPRLTVAIVVVPIVLLMSWAATKPPPADTPGIGRLLVSLCACLLLLRLRMESRWLAWIGAWSFGIYLFHPVFTAASRMALQRAGVHDLAVLLVVGVITGLACSIALTAGLRRSSTGRWITGERLPAAQDAELGAAKKSLT
ncbi:acyltransferase [Mitsuaria sp. GD03876]|uniref:acyltransferase family protein n=1 Tax=Mitsuaria sp. GD03876 TaxID=2975399 RepID=UPI0024498150|nr:acyltransferase [Mitsuaria sp. GD03876]MDH0864983.1 acyltransferase [Mitsuaria sp. GD03876]